MTTPFSTDGPESALVPVTDMPPAERSTEVAGTVGMVDGELVVRIKPTQYRDVTSRRVSPDSGIEVAPHPLARLGLRYVGPLTPEEAARFRAEVARWQTRPWWRWWGSDFGDWCWGWRR
jgi:CubicO group peptidase (beta-lactamase class C family)